MSGAIVVGCKWLTPVMSVYFCFSFPLCFVGFPPPFPVRFDGIMQERRNSIANALELRLSCTNPSILFFCWDPPSPSILCWFHVAWGQLHFRLEPLLARIKESRTAVLCPEIDVIDAHSLKYSGVGGSSVGGFWWSLHFSWRPMPKAERERRQHSTDPIR